MAVVAGHALTGRAQASESRDIHIESTPAGAEVSTIGGRQGVTPLTLSARAVYPNTWPQARAGLYGMVIIRKSGCRAVTRRITEDDMQHGLDIHLDCADPVHAAGANAPEQAQAGGQPERAAAALARSLPERRLQQLKVLDELLEDKLISAEEERAIRQRIFDRLGQ